MNQKFRGDVGIVATDTELQIAVNELPEKLRHIIALCYALFGHPERTTKQIAQLVLNEKTSKPISTGYLLMLRGKGLRYIRYQLDYQRAEKHSSGIPINIKFWLISNRGKRILERLKAETIDQVLRVDFRFMGRAAKRELMTYLKKHGLTPDNPQDQVSAA
jgi:hypothetical protein